MFCANYNLSMSSNPKNELQEFFQKNKLPVPKYFCERNGGTDHEPLWISTIVFHDGTVIVGPPSSNKTMADMTVASIALNSLDKLTKTLSPIKCHKSINSLSSPINCHNSIKSTNSLPSPINCHNSNKPNTSSVKCVSLPTSPTICNKSTKNKSINTTENKKRIAVLVDVENLHKFIEGITDRLNEFTVYAFIGIHHCLSDKEYPDNVIKILSPSTRPDGTDTCMQVYTGMLLSQEKYDEYIIVTRDHFGSSLVEMIIYPSFGWKPKPARLVTKPSQL